MNQADSSRISRLLQSAGWHAVDRPEDAELVILNSCAVRQSAEERVLGKLGFLSGLKKAGGLKTIALIGCMVGADNTELTRRLPYVDLFLPPGADDALLAAMGERRLQQVTAEGSYNPAGYIQYSGPSRYVPIMTGCDNFCSYCIVPYRRGREHSRSLTDIVTEIESLIEKGVREVTLLGQNVNSYGKHLAEKVDLADLLYAVQAIAGLRRIRFLTSHPKDMSPRLIAAVATLDKVCHHLNLPVQAGDDRILELMNRRYTADDYRSLVAGIRAAIPDIALSTDLIVGFPGETAAEFENSMQLLRDIKFDTVHVAMYSPRAGTAASQLADDVPPHEKMGRLRQVEELQADLSLQANQQLVGSTVEILVEGQRKNSWFGRTKSDRLVFFNSRQPLLGQLVHVELEHAGAWSLRGRLSHGEWQ